MDCKASIIITTMNRALLMAARALKSALAQTYNDYEIIIVDDAGTDNTEEVVNLYQKKRDNIRYFKLPENKGLSYARNFGVSQAKGKYIVCLDDDNELLPEFLEKTIKKIEGTRKKVGAVSVGRIIKYRDFEDYAMPYMGDTFTAIDWGWLIRKEVFDEIEYDEDMRANEDTDFGIQFFKRFRWGIIHEPLTLAFDMDSPKESLSFPCKRELDGMTYFFNKNIKEYDDPAELRCLYRLMGRKFYRGGHKLKGLGYFWKSFRAQSNFNSFANLFFILFGWWIYDKFMEITEKIGSKKRWKLVS